MTNSTHASKVVVLLRRQARIQALLDAANSLAFSRHDEKYEDLLISYAWKGLFHHAVYQSFGGIAVFCWGFTPIADLVAGRSRRLPMEGWYPYNTTATPAFEITAAHQGIAIIIACFHNVAMDTLMTGLIVVACSQLAILEHNITSIDNEEGIRKLQNSDNDKSGSLAAERRAMSSSYQLLKRCAVHNNMIFHFTNEIQDIFGTVIFFQFLSNCVIICLIAFKVSQMKVYIPAVLIGMLTYMCCMTYQIFIFCWHEHAFSHGRVLEQLVLQHRRIQTRPSNRDDKVSPSVHFERRQNHDVVFRYFRADNADVLFDFYGTSRFGCLTTNSLTSVFVAIYIFSLKLPKKAN
ncbi:PREDICTED: odorant receptor Or1-like isoform X2 [Wasmannia auropunctata]|uniref:odorant receptor Or1-like isoform X2 n=1 Tax=Wasmannia auropunctata TaxID=64793 RepID=UPI0005EFFF66|nr:PREDICTED: odorant receptor Or1-like isoform X2 [Wasmannia auropunctata]